MNELWIKHSWPKALCVENKILHPGTSIIFCVRAGKTWRAALEEAEERARTVRSMNPDFFFSKWNYEWIVNKTFVAEDFMCRK